MCPNDYALALPFAESPVLRIAQFGTQFAVALHLHESTRLAGASMHCDCDQAINRPEIFFTRSVGMGLNRKDVR